MQMLKLNLERVKSFSIREFTALIENDLPEKRDFINKIYPFIKDKIIFPEDFSYEDDDILKKIITFYEKGNVIREITHYLLEIDFYFGNKNENFYIENEIFLD